jgi:hypothetical protein
MNTCYGGYEVDWQLPDDADRTDDRQSADAVDRPIALAQGWTAPETNGLGVAAPSRLRQAFDVAHPVGAAQ